MASQARICLAIAILAMTLCNFYIYHNTGASRQLLRGLGLPDTIFQSFASSQLEWPTASVMPKTVTIAYVISITDCGTTIHIDGAAILKHSIHLRHIRSNSSRKSGMIQYTYKMYAIVHPEAEQQCQVGTVLEKELGYQVLYRTTPVGISEIRSGSYLQKTIDQSGCCGIKELMKVHAYALIEHYIVVLLDLDTLILKPLDDLFDIILSPASSESKEERMQLLKGLMDDKDDIDGTMLSRPINAFFTRDYGMANFNVRRVGIQGGFLVLRPNLKTFNDLISIVKEANFTEGGGWGGLSGGRFWGDMQIQGLISYYYDIVRPNSAVEITNCQYNNMAQSSREGQASRSDDQDKMNSISSLKRARGKRLRDQNCSDINPSNVRVFHYTICQKPWECFFFDGQRKSDILCQRMHHEWYLTRLDLELQSPKLSWTSNRRGTTDPDMFLGYCSKYGTDGYLPLKTMAANSRGGALKNDNLNNKESKVDVQGVEERKEGKSLTATISCEKYGGPIDEIAQEMVYWSDIPSDAKFVSPFKRPTTPQFMTFEPDHGGWNNIRMAMEVVLAMAVSTGRTLVLPPRNEMYLLNNQNEERSYKDRGKHETHFTFQDFFHLDDLAEENDALDIISMEEFLRTQALRGKLLDFETKKPIMPPINRTNWDGQNLQALWKYLRSVGHVPTDWQPEKCALAIPTNTGREGIDSVRRLLDDIIRNDGGSAPAGNSEATSADPIPVSAPALDRLREMLSHRRKLCYYDEQMQDAPLVHIMTDSEKDARMLTHFYAFIFFEDWRQDLWMKRFIRDHVRYLDEIICAAARVVDAVRERARRKEPLMNTNINANENSRNGLFDSFHIRRGDFQFSEALVSANVIYTNTKDVLQFGSTLFIATDERNRTFFNPLASHYDVCFLDDFLHLIQDVNTDYYGMIDQLVASRGRNFVGTWWSTFTGYINRMRGYYSGRYKSIGFQNGTIRSWYFVPLYYKNCMRLYSPLNGGFWTREWPTSWREIDHGISEIS